MEKAHEVRDIDLSTAARGVWLVKVPKYLSEKWEKAPGNTDIGKLRISKPRFPGGKPEVVFSLADDLTVNTTGDGTTVPKDHKFILTGIDNQKLSVLSRTPSETEEYAEKVAIEGKIIQRGECRPIADKNYMSLKRIQLEKMNKPQKEVIQIDKVVNTYKPVARHSHHEASERNKKEGKHVRDSKEHVVNMLFAAFEKHQYYSLKDLVNLTKQPVTYLKEQLKEICNYNMKAPHRNMWELKPEFRHYKEQK